MKEADANHDHLGHDVQIGENSVVSPGVYIIDHCRIGRDVYIGPNASIGGSQKDPADAGDAMTVIEDGASIGALSFIANGLRIGNNATVLEGAVVTKSVPPNAIVGGNPAFITGYSTQSNRGHRETNVESHQSVPIEDSSITGLPVFADIRGALTVGNFASDVPFQPARFFMVYGVPSRETRGEHAHKVCHQFLICVSGSCRVLADDGTTRRDILLDAPHKGLHLPPMTWGTQYDYSQDAVLLVFASHAYDPNEYIRTYDEFTDAVRQQERKDA